MYVSFLGCVYKEYHPTSCSKLYKEIEAIDLNNLALITSYLLDLWNERGKDCPSDCEAYSFCTMNKEKVITVDFVSTFAKNITYYNNDVKKQVGILQAKYKYDNLNKNNKKRKNDSQLSLF